MNITLILLTYEFIELPAGKDVHFLVGFANRGSKDFIVEAMDASFRYPLDFTFHIQNVSFMSFELYF